MLVHVVLEAVAFGGSFKVTQFVSLLTMINFHGQQFLDASSCDTGSSHIFFP
jgi:hypothetical protein